MVEHPYGWLSLFPPLVAIVLAIATRQVVVSLGVGVFVGALVLTGGDPVMAVTETFQNHIWEKFNESNLLYIFGFTAIMGGMVGVINRAGGMRGLVNVVSLLARNRVLGQLATWFLGLFVFFDDYANTVLLGNTLRPLTDRLKISREKLAYLVDSTAAPVSGLALISTWVAGELDYISSGIEKLPVAVDDWNAFTIFVDTIPYRFYVLLTLLFVPIVALMRRDFGPMYKAEMLAIDGEERFSATSRDEIEDPTSPAKETPARWFNAVIPVFVTVGAVLWLMYCSGYAEVVEATPDEAPTLREVFGDADSYGSLLWGSLYGLIAAIALVVPQRLLPINEVFKAAGAGVRLMVPALAILWMASTLSTMTGNKPPADVAQGDAKFSLAASALLQNDVALPDVLATIKDQGASLSQVASVAIQEANEEAVLQTELFNVGFDEPEVVALVSRIDFDDSGGPELKFQNRDHRLYTGAFLSGLVGDKLSPVWLPTIVFLLASFVAFSTGTSWGTMGIVMPLIIPMVYGVLSGSEVEVAPDHPIFLASVAGVLAGAIFGDHCSPISDTTVLSSQASGCDHVAHVRTQLPYAALVAVVSVLFGTLPIGFGVPVWLTLPAGVIALVVALRVLGKRV